MPIYTVQQGDYLARIAKTHGYSDWKLIWNDPKNMEIKKKRQNPNLLYPGDQLFIPEREQREEVRPTAQRHRFRRKMKVLKLRIVLKDVQSHPLANKNCILRVSGKDTKLATKADGLLELAIPATSQNAKLLMEDPRLAMAFNLPIQIGHLDPIDTLSGQKARLNNLGYRAGSIDGEDEAMFRSAVEEFQVDFLGKSEVDGNCGSKTQAKLKEIYGC